MVYPWHRNGSLNSDYKRTDSARSAMLDNKKMSKSIGNILKIRELSEKYSGSDLRHFLLSAHYRSPLNFSEEQLEQSKNSLDTLKNLIFNLNHIKEKDVFSEKIDDLGKELLSRKRELENKFIEAMDDDLNTPVALSTLFLLAKSANVYINSDAVKNKKVIDEVLDFYQQYGNDILGFKEETADKSESYVNDKEIEELVEKREKARKNKDWKTADEIRDQLKEMDIILEDTVDGIRWKKA